MSQASLCPFPLLPCCTQSYLISCSSCLHGRLTWWALCCRRLPDRWCQIWVCWGSNGRNVRAEKFVIWLEQQIGIRKCGVGLWAWLTSWWAVALSSRGIMWELGRPRAGLFIDMETNSYNEGSVHVGKVEDCWAADMEDGGRQRPVETESGMEDCFIRRWPQFNPSASILNSKYRSLKSQAHISTV